MGRYLLQRVAEDFNVSISYNPKLFKDWNGAGGHINYSTVKTRNEEGAKHFDEILDKLSKKHSEHLELYGDNSKRLTGLYETSSRENFNHGLGDRGASVRIPTTTVDDKKGYIEDRRPASDIDPFVACSILVDTTLLSESKIEPLRKHYRAWKAFAAATTFEV